ncbi:MAG: caspase family protein [Bacteroidota bacterium]
MKLCSDDPVLYVIRKLLQANALRVPRSDFQPFALLESSNRGRRNVIRGQLKNYLKEPDSFPFSDNDLSRADVASISGKQSNAVNVDMGVSILGGFLAGFGVNMPSLKSKFSSITEFSYSFKDVESVYIDEGKLGGALENLVFSPTNPANKKFFKKGIFTKKQKPLIVDRVLISNNFSIHISKASMTNMDLEVKALVEELGQLTSNITVAKENSQTISFSGPEKLPFAFSCVELELDEEGKVIDLSAAKVRGEDNTKSQPISHKLLSDEPQLLDFSSPSLHALLVGINEYANNNHGVTPLTGCINDMNGMHETLKEHANTHSLFEESDIYIKCLKNEEATREAIISSFRSHLSMATKAGDTALFYFSGHGGRENASKEFREFFHSDKLEYIVCHDANVPGIFGIADKELAVLISEIPEEVHVVIILDCCHSGSGTRFQNSRNRTVYLQKPARSLDQFIDKFYQKQKEKEGRVFIPTRPHILLAAADRTEPALETWSDSEDNSTGLFTSYLTSALKKDLTDFSYSSIFDQLIYRSPSLTRAQRPQLESPAGQSPFVRFLSGEANSSPRLSKVFFQDNDDPLKKGGWMIKQGGIHGLRYPDSGDLMLPVFEDSRGEKQIGLATVQKIGFQKSTVTFNFEPGSDIHKVFYSYYLTTKIPVFWANKNKHEELDDIWNKEVINWVNTEEDAAYVIKEFEEVHAFSSGERQVKGVGLYELTDKDQFIRICADELRDQESFQFINQQLVKIAGFTGLLNLKEHDGEHYRDIDTSDFNVRIEFVKGSNRLELKNLLRESDEKNGDLDQNLSVQRYSLPAPTFEEVEEGAIPPRYTIEAIHTTPKQADHRNNKSGIYFSLILLTPDFGVQMLYNDAQPQNQGQPTKLDRHPLKRNSRHPEPIIDYFLVIASREPLESGTLEQPGIEEWMGIRDRKRLRIQGTMRNSNARDILTDTNVVNTSKTYDWVVKRIEIELIG